jgi:serine kinase of HPr protein (carbohydrate metabolism regulator)
VILHAGLIARLEAGRWRGVLIDGPSGSGKSDLALRALDAGWALVADDRTRVWTSGGRLYGRAAPNLSGLIEARGVGVVSRAMRHFAPIALLASCVGHEAVERTPDFEAQTLIGVAIPRVRLAALETSAMAKLACALSLLGLDCQRAYQAPRAGLSQPAGGDP